VSRPQRAGPLTEDETTFGQLGDRFDRAARSAGILERRFRIAGETLLLRFSGPALAAKLTAAFAHLADDGKEATGLTVDVWDSVSTGTDAPPLPTVDAERDPFGAVYFFGSPPARAAYQPGPRIMSAFDGDKRAWYWVADAADLPYWDAAAPIRQILHWWLEERGLQLVHGGAVGRPEGGVLLVGRGGSGKSTSALSSLESDLRYAGDDYVIVSGDGGPRVHSLYNSGKVEPHHLERLPHLRKALANPDRLSTEKAIVYVEGNYPGRMIEGFPLRAVLVPRITDRTRPRIVAAPRAAALMALAPSTIFQLHPQGGQALSAMARLVDRVPSYFLELGSDIDALPVEIGRLLDTLGAAS
jgi:hypothetical protein